MHQADLTSRLRSNTTTGQFSAVASLISISGVAFLVPRSISLIRPADTPTASARAALVSPAFSRA